MHAAHAGTTVYWFSTDVMQHTSCTTSTLWQWFKKRKEKGKKTEEKFSLCRNHNGSLLKRQPKASQWFNHCRSAKSSIHLTTPSSLAAQQCPQHTTSQVYLSADELEMGGAGPPLLCPLPFQQVQRPRLLICGEEGSGQSHLGPALLYALEGLPVHALGLPSLLSNASARSVLFLTIFLIFLMLLYHNLPLLTSFL